MLKQLLLKIMLISALALMSSNKASGQSVNSDSWAATDALGRKVRSYDEAPAKRKDRTVAIFYWTWHQGNDDKDYEVKNISEILREHPEALKDYNHPAWGDKKPGFFFWEQPLLGYYKTTDKWVLRKHAELLADAGVNAVFFDCTNGHLTWKESYEALLETWEEARRDGVNVPKVAFMLNLGINTSTIISLRQLYNDLYKPGRYKDLWFIWKGKPCIMAYPDLLSESEEDKEIAEFFTFRPGQPDYVNGPSADRNDQWGWLENYPQHGYVSEIMPDGRQGFEQVTVGVAQNTSPQRQGHCGAFNVKDSQGRDFSVRNGFDPRPDGYLYGWNISEQWERAYELDPELVFVTGWNEYIAGIWLPKDGWDGDPFSFVDQFDWKHSRDIEPNKGWGDKGDVYYLQLVDRIRKYKGMTPAEQVSGPRSIRMGKTGDWEDVRPYFGSYKGNTFHRDAEGRYNQYYVNKTGRNDITGAKVARDDRYIWFYVETAERLSPDTDPHWMQLFIDTDRDKASGWNGYDFVVNRLSPAGGAILEKNVQGIWEWEKTATCKYSVQGNILVIRIPRQALGLTGDKLDFEFKWNDNMQVDGDIMDFYVNGDTAPGGRFNFVYTTATTSEK